jgi:hypothetical protein
MEQTGRILSKAFFLAYSKALAAVWRGCLGEFAGSVANPKADSIYHDALLGAFRRKLKRSLKRLA